MQLSLSVLVEQIYGGLGCYEKTLNKECFCRLYDGIYHSPTLLGRDVINRACYKSGMKTDDETDILV